MRGPGGLFHFHVVGTNKVAVAAHGGDLAHLGHGGQSARQLANDFFFVRAQLVDADLGRAKVHAQIGHVADLVHHRGHMQQGLGGNAAHVQADPAQGGVALDQNHFQAQVGSTESGGVAARAGAQDQDIAIQVGVAAKRGCGRCRGRRGGGRCCRGGWGRSRRGSGFTGRLQHQDHRAFGHFVAQLDLEFFHHASM